MTKKLKAVSLLTVILSALLLLFVREAAAQTHIINWAEWGSASESGFSGTLNGANVTGTLTYNDGANTHTPPTANNKASFSNFTPGINSTSTLDYRISVNTDGSSIDVTVNFSEAQSDLRMYFAYLDSSNIQFTGSHTESLYFNYGPETSYNALTRVLTDTSFPSAGMGPPLEGWSAHGIMLFNNGAPTDSVSFTFLKGTAPSYSGTEFIDITFTSLTPVPEPGTGVLLLSAFAGAVFLWKRGKQVEIAHSL